MDATKTSTRYLSCADTAKLLRVALKKAFPAVKFSVTSKTYSGGASVDVGWTDGPTTKAVDAIAQRYSGANFDGMIDLKTYNESYLMPDGSVEFAHTPGTEGSRGFIPAVDNPQPEGAEQVHFGADFVFTNRHYTVEFLTKCAEKVCKKYGVALPVIVAGHGYGAYMEPGEIAGGMHGRPVDEFIKLYTQNTDADTGINTEEEEEKAREIRYQEQERGRAAQVEIPQTPFPVRPQPCA